MPSADEKTEAREVKWLNTIYKLVRMLNLEYIIFRDLNDLLT